MKHRPIIAVDLRAADCQPCGVLTYIRELLPELVAAGSEFRWILWWNSRRPAPDWLKKIAHENVHAEILATKYSNRWLNFRLLAGWTGLDRVISRAANNKPNIDAIWLPDPRPIDLTNPTKIIATFHDLSFERFPQFFSWRTRLWHRLLKPKNLAWHADRLLAVSSFTARELAEFWNIEPEKIAVTPLAGLHRARPEQKEIEQVLKKYELKKKFVLALGTVEPRKNLRFLVERFEQARLQTGSDAELVIAGGRNGKIFSASRLQKKDWLRQLGPIEEAEIAPLLAASLGLAFPSCYEGFGLPVAEALQLGTPVIAANLPSLAEFADGAAELIPLANKNAWGIALAGLISDPVKRTQLAGRTKAAAKLSWKKTAQLTLRAFEEMLQD